MIDDDIRRCAKMLESVVRMDGLSARQLEEKLGYGAGTVNRLFSGKIELKLRHILLILEVIGIPPSQFFREVFPEDGRPRSEPEMASRLLDLLERHVPKRPTRPAPAGVSDDDLDRRILEALGRLGVTSPASSGSSGSSGSSSRKK
jgi:transcriptional regulator with XRE-family HTH domain